VGRVLRKNTMTRFASVLVVSLIAVTASCAAQSDLAKAQESPTRVILFIGDGAGTAHWTGAAFASDNLAVRQFPVVGLVVTRASNRKITDSAAAATAYSAGVKTYNGAIGVDADTNSVPTVLEIARDRGMATGLVATSSITHATPAAFAAHVPRRSMEFEIARQIVAADVNVILGGGRRFFDQARRPDWLDLLSDIAANYAYVETEAELRGLDTGDLTKLFGLFAVEAMPPAPSRSPTLPSMAEAALEVLDNDPDGFFLMVEGSQPDWRAHDNDSLEAVVAEMLDLDRAIGVALEYRRLHPETLIVVTADHETGGLAVQMAGQSDRTTHAPYAGDASDLVARYTTGSHTAEMVPLFATGPGAERFGGINDNAEIGALLMETVRR
jgi:alkaline phosphatase